MYLFRVFHLLKFIYHDDYRNVLDDILFNAFFRQLLFNHYIDFISTKKLSNRGKLYNLSINIQT